VLVALALLTLPVVWSPTASAVGESQSLSLEPADGPPGTTVTWVANGFGDCPPADDAVPGGVVALEWDATDELGRASVSELDGSATSTFVVPESAPDEHPVTATCVGDGAMTTSEVFTVTPPDVDQVEVPDVVGLTESRARGVLAQADLVVGEVTGDGVTVLGQSPPAESLVDPGTPVNIDLGTAAPDLVEVPNLFGLRLDDARGSVESAGLEFGEATGDSAGLVTGQSPPAGEPVPRGTIVRVTLESPTPRLVTVPDLVGQTLGDVPDRLARRGLELGLVSGDGEVVRRQNPRAGSRVPRGSAVNVSVEPGVRPRRLVRVPDLLGDTVSEARAALASADLVLGETTEDSGEIASQQPRAGTLVPPGSTVTVVLEQGPGWATLVVAAALLVGAVAVAYRVVRPPLDRRWVRSHVRVASGGRPRAAGVTEPTGDPSPRTQVVRIEPRDDSGTHVLEESPR
jgi:beta-lactam-binding protein with PASTA domain